MLKAPNLLLIYQKQVAHEIKGVPKKDELEEMLRMVSFFHDVNLEEKAISDLVQDG